ncbi:hypothetical protein PC116_g420 [Phytophthora cactorum]|uniref:Uncharacterized protein n=1 Tax=Phytophthora cactorum TaxID=29920 RepID=A0A329RYY2_9STRA|nr:hypothetical protein Pcac1_g304 [Phytophthora cactorum]KAG2848853.1 hypothetical protein PC111_g263 [Phytophthora cactorum]KAG2849194.1 hypothetical protein PC112_g412 [Phytophthora cactorum]KAG2869119.1 hypothetical protein PC113_g497 [Phytophthora cactorum]KAG2934999.1 hypothetical protein PC114_g775 [Phytophthora cactorum]
MLAGSLLGVAAIVFGLGFSHGARTVLPYGEARFAPSSFSNEGDRLRRELAPVSAGASPDEVTALEATSVASCSVEPLPRGLELLV